jgi:two-component system sensor kinase FixL
VREIEWHTSVLRDAEGAPSGVLSIGQDITERSRAEARVRGLEKIAQGASAWRTSGAITAKIAHDLREPALRRIAASTGGPPTGAARSEPALGSVTKPLEQLVSEVRRLEELIREFLASRASSASTYARSTCPAFLDGVVELWRPVASAHGVKLQLRGSDAVGRVEADEASSARVLDNLVKNAIEALGESPGESHGRSEHALRGEGTYFRRGRRPESRPPCKLFRLFEDHQGKTARGSGSPCQKQIVLTKRASATFPPASRSPMIPEPTTASSRKAVPSASAARR